MDKSLIYSLLFAVAFWTLPFILRLFIVEMPKIDNVKLQRLPNTENIALEETLRLLSEGDKQGAFVNIFVNNLKSCILNILGGVMLGLGTLINMLFNGFVFADACVSFYNSGMTIHAILKVTVPHSFELIGIWLSGGIGFYIAWLITCFMLGKESFTSKKVKLIVIHSIIVFLIILSAAYVEAFITSTFIK